MKKILLSVTIALIIVFYGCEKDTQGYTAEVDENNVASAEVQEIIVPQESTNTGQRLQFSVVASEIPGYTVIYSEELGGKSNIDIVYSSLSEVNLNWKGENISLPEAIRTGAITIPELFSFARMDAADGFCEEKYVSEHGLTHFAYVYSQCELHLTYDVLETPSGKQELIEEIVIRNIPKGQHSISYYYRDEESEWGYALDREDWGLTFEIATVTPEEIILNYTQKDGQQIGDLVIDGYTVYPRQKNEETNNVPNYVGKTRLDTEGLPISIRMNASGQIIIDWTSVAGTLQPGNYYIQLNVLDIYNVSEVHPLMENYHDIQGYHIPFSIE